MPAEGLVRLLDLPDRPGWRGAEAVLALLTATCRADDAESGRAALTALVDRPRALIRLDEAARRLRWWVSEEATRLVVRKIDVDLSRGTASPLGIALASTHGDGRVRERAVQEIIARPSPELVPFLVLRTTDWVREVRSRAGGGLAVLLHDDPERYLPAALRVGLLMRERWRGAFVHNQLLAAATDRRAPLAALLESPDRDVRAFAFTSGTWRLDEKVSVASTGADRWLRSTAAEAVARDAVWTDRVELLRRLAASPHAEVRVQALTGLVRLGHDADAVARLTDESPLIRALARAAAARTGVDVAEHYRSRVTVEAIDGFAEVGGDGRHLVGLLAHPSPRIRARAVRALRLLGQLPDERVASLLRDPSPAVVREAARAGAAKATIPLPPELAWELLGDARPGVRSAGYSLAPRQGPGAALRAALVAVGDPHGRLARRGRVDAARWAGLMEPSPWSKSVVRLDVDAAGVAELRALLDRVAAELDERTVGRLRAVLG